MPNGPGPGVYLVVKQMQTMDGGLNRDFDISLSSQLCSRFGSRNIQQCRLTAPRSFFPVRAMPRRVARNVPRTSLR